MATIFTRIIEGEIPCYKVAEDRQFIAFLDITPVQLGHTLVVPKPEVDYIFDHSPELLSAMLPFAQRVARAIKEVVPCNRIGVAVQGLEVPHAHMHLIPISHAEDMRLGQKLNPLPTPEQQQVLCEKIGQAYLRLLK